MLPRNRIPAEMDGGPVGSASEPLPRPVSRESVAHRAYAIFLARGRTPGMDQQDWFQAEQELRAELQRTLPFPGEAEPATAKAAGAR